MIVSWNWLKQYVTLDMPLADLEMRLMMSGLNHEGTEHVGDDIAIDLEVTSNRPDCLGHLGVAREVAVLWDRPLDIPPARPSERGAPARESLQVTIRAEELCPRYTARLIRGVKVGPSPDWLREQLKTVGIAAVNNIVDITNYVLFESAQPLHAFDFSKLAGQEILVREAVPGEKFEAINHKTYELGAGMCVIADANRPVALGGVMGGAATEVSAATTDLLIEAAEFDPVSIRNTARKLNLHSPASYRFERGLDPEGVDWASRRCCQLILELAGGELAGGVVESGEKRIDRPTIVLRLAQLKRILGIEIDPAEVRKILTSLGGEEQAFHPDRVLVIPPTWRRDLSREIDLVEEVARIHGYDKIPEDVGVPMVASARSDHDRVVERVRSVLVCSGFDEAMTSSAVEAAWSTAMNPWCDAEALRSRAPILRGADRLRQSLIPSLLGARRTNESLAADVIELFEIAKIYLPREGELPDEQVMLGMTSGADFLTLKGVVEAIVEKLNPAARVEVRDWKLGLLEEECSVELRLGERTLGFLGQVSGPGQKQFGLRGPTTVAELKLSVLLAVAHLVPQHVEQSSYPAIDRDVNLEIDESVRWADVAEVVRARGGEHLESLTYRDTYHDDTLRAAGKKSLLFSAVFRSAQGTLTNQEVDKIRDAIVARCEKAIGATLRA